MERFCQSHPKGRVIREPELTGGKEQMPFNGFVANLELLPDPFQRVAHPEQSNNFNLAFAHGFFVGLQSGQK
jgi:hypothetical protein